VSWDILDWAFRQQVPRSLKLTLVAVAKCCDAQGVTFAGQRKLAAMSSVSERQVRTTLTKLGELGLISRFHRQRGDGSRTTDLIVLGMPRGAIDLTVYSGVIGDLVEGDKVATGSGLPGVPEVLGSPTGSPLPGIDLPELSMEGERAPAPVLLFNSKPVNEESWELAKKVLTEFNRQTGKKIRAVSADGSMSEGIKRIYSRIRKYRDLELEDFEDIIRRTLASKWWGDGEVSPGVVFGPAVFEDNITRAGVPKTAKDSERRQRAAADREAIQRILKRTGGDES
jgi:hypothetical protein